MARVKTEPWDWQKVAKDANERLGKIVETRYTIVEVTPGEYDNERDTVWPDKSVRVYTADTLKKISDWQDDHEPDTKRNYFEVYEEELRETIVRNWRYGKKIFPVDKDK